MIQPQNSITPEDHFTTRIEFIPWIHITHETHNALAVKSNLQLVIFSLKINFVASKHLPLGFFIIRICFIPSIYLDPSNLF